MDDSQSQRSEYENRKPPQTKNKKGPNAKNRDKTKTGGDRKGRKNQSSIEESKESDSEDDYEERSDGESLGIMVEDDKQKIDIINDDTIPRKKSKRRSNR